MPYRAVIVEALTQTVERVGRARGPAAKRGLGRGAFGDVSYVLDRMAERVLIRVVREHLPDSFIISEESGALGSKDAEHTVLIDPVDGSTNAVRGVPFYSSAIAILEGKTFQDIAAAGVADLVRGEVFIGEKEKGVFLDGRAAQPSTNEMLDDACVSINLRMSKLIPTYFQIYGAMLRTIRYPRFLGSAALETAYVAAGRVDAFVEPIPRLRTFDCIPSLFLVKEAGGAIRTLNIDLKNADLRKPLRFAYIASGTPRLNEAVFELIKGSSSP